MLNPSSRRRGGRMLSCLLVYRVRVKQRHVRNWLGIIRLVVSEQLLFAQILSVLVLSISSSKMRQKQRSRTLAA
ncbi:hypothetical protein EMPG_17590 [Blastomyces silverae]|uniref:Uncharacterized protein n=1 Tax=Blastomyces silverae TaxID=2060906 RepID=A0A0H1B772_9EURO|nr:hypothetical protein EMPG_17590 [Blastomyces silverae]